MRAESPKAKLALVPDSLGFIETVTRVLLAIAAGAAIGLERELSAQPAGLRTHLLLSLGACLFALAGLTYSAGDPSRIAAQVASGVGFLGAGVILRDQFRVKGLTTAASLWVAAALGVAAGAGAYEAGAIITVAALVVLVGLKWVEDVALRRHREQQLSVTLIKDAPMAHAISVLRGLVPTMVVTHIASMQGGGHRITARIHLPRDYDIVVIVEQMRRVEGIEGVEISQ